MTVALIGATGTIGPHIVAATRATGEPVRVITRNAERAATLLPGDTDIVEADITVAEAVIEAAAGADSLLLLTSHAHDTTDLQLRIIRALRRTGAKIVKISGTSNAITPDGPFAARQHWEVEHVLAGSGQPFVVLRPNGFMQTLIGQQVLPALHATGTVTNAIGTAGISFIDARDIADAAAAALTADRWDGRTVALTGPRSVTYAEIAELVAARTGRPVPVKEVTPADVRAMLSARGMAEWEAEHFEEMYTMLRGGGSEFVTDGVRELAGHPPRTVEDYLAEQVSELSGAPA